MSMISDAIRRFIGGDEHEATGPVQAVWNGVVLAESERTVVVEGNHYPSPSPAARRIKDDVACWHGVKIRRAARA